MHNIGFSKHSAIHSCQYVSTQITDRIDESGKIKFEIAVSTASDFFLLNTPKMSLFWDEVRAIKTENMSWKTAKRRATHTYKNKGTLAYEHLLGNAKSVAIVGPSPCIIGLGLGPEIDSHDVVVRLNQGALLSENLSADFGLNCNLVYTDYCSIFKEFWKLHQPDNAIAVCTRKYVQHGSDVANPRFTITHKTRNINTGIRACLDVKTFSNLQRISVYGFSFYTDKNKYAIDELAYTMNRGTEYLIHDQIVNKKVFKRFMEDERVFVHTSTLNSLNLTPLFDC